MKGVLTKTRLLALICAFALPLCACGEKEKTLDYKAILLDAGFEVFDENTSSSDPDIVSGFVVDRSDGDEEEIVNYILYQSADTAVADFNDIVKSYEEDAQDDSDQSIGVGTVNSYQVMVAYDDSFACYEIAAQRDTSLLIFDFYQEDYDHIREILNKIEITQLPDLKKLAEDDPEPDDPDNDPSQATQPQHIIEFTAELNEYFTAMCYKGPAVVYAAADDEHLITVEFSGNSGHWGQLPIEDDMRAQKLALDPLLDYMQNARGYTVAKLSLPLFDLEGNDVGVFVYDLNGGEPYCDITANGVQLRETLETPSPAANASTEAPQQQTQSVTIQMLAEEAGMFEAPDVVLEPDDPPHNIGGWKDGNRLTWLFDVETHGDYIISINYARPHLDTDIWGTLDIYLEGDPEPWQRTFSPVATSDTENDWSQYKDFEIAEIHFEPGSYRLEMYPGYEGSALNAEHFINLRSISLTLESSVEHD